MWHDISHFSQIDSSLSWIFIKNFTWHFGWSPLSPVSFRDTVTTPNLPLECHVLFLLLPASSMKTRRRLSMVPARDTCSAGTLAFRQGWSASGRWRGQLRRWSGPRYWWRTWSATASGAIGCNRRTWNKFSFLSKQVFLLFVTKFHPRINLNQYYLCKKKLFVTTLKAISTTIKKRWVATCHLCMHFLQCVAYSRSMYNCFKNATDSGNRMRKLWL